MKTRLVVVTHDYLDGIEMAEIREPAEWDEHAREVDVRALDAYTRAWEKLREAEKRLLDAWSEAEERPNPKYEPTDEVEG